MMAAKLRTQKIGQNEVAWRLGVHRQSVIRQARRLAQSGRTGQLQT
jgi:hypothetical protein